MHQVNSPMSKTKSNMPPTTFVPAFLNNFLAAAFTALSVA
jgi:hypothetical protein